MDGQQLKTSQDFSSRCKNTPSIYDIADTITEETNLDYTCLFDAQKLALYLYQYDDYVVFLRTITKYFGWSRYKVRKLRKEINNNKNCNYYIDISPCFNEETGLIDGNGYQLDILTNLR